MRGRRLLGMLAKLAESALGMLGEARDIDGGHLEEDELHHIWCIKRILVLKNGPKHLTLDEIHDINFLAFTIRTGLEYLVSMV